MSDGGLVKILQESDYICNVLPNTPETTNILGNGVLKECSGILDRLTKKFDARLRDYLLLISAKQPTLINIGRSNIVSESDLLTAIDSGWISAAVLDVFDKEPLPGRG